ncbi:O-acetyl-ADP-ribose deacetylase (regulator of RNase III) [Planomicrobium soli]|uniref:O-acetyl-ADP-ribose deacetylase (Regulator of RNase III) n=1 Tax=Planomicrobium soli TaxID=1176648 RepID=A0A2P8H6F4_9BACL|nr:macro domain-containing protein [Planomicrobium soli]PSL41817.1 O-acetyl-ADP-ribose deacetylase (regulator of RNase III) [Planomicrobium soli]
MPIEIIRNDITKMKVDVIVNAANSGLQMGGGVCGAIFQAAGAKELQAACDKIGHCPVGGAVITDAYRLDARFIIHTVGPVWRGGSQNEEELLRACYGNSLRLALENGCDSIAFPLISSGIYGYPKEQALHVAISEISAFLMEHEILVYIVVFDQKAFGLSGKLFHSIHQYIDEHYVEEQNLKFSYGERRMAEMQAELMPQSQLEALEDRSLEDLLGQIEESFSERLFRFIDEKGMTDVSTYKKANIDRKLFHKIKNSSHYTPLKKTIVAFAIALELNLDETNELLNTAGYVLSNSNKFDVIITYFIERENYNIFEINEALFAFDQMLLGA